jgi:hypothetical protein
MKATIPSSETAWLWTNLPVASINASMRNHLPVLQEVLRRGVVGIQDASRAGFYEIEDGDNWYYVHIPNRISNVYLISAGRKLSKDSSASVAMARSA